MNFVPFEMERYQSWWENVVEFNLSESGVHPLTLNEFVTAEEIEKLRALPLGYSQTNGTEALRSQIARLYPNAEINQVLVTTGSIEANFLITHRLLNSGDGIAFMMPNYMQIWGIAQSLRTVVTPFFLRPLDNRWQIDWEEFDRAVTPKTKLIAICQPNNPTGAQLHEDEIDKICRAAQKYGAWILSDEIYRGAEFDGNLSPTFWGKYERVCVSGGLSKAYGLPGLRLGWIVGPANLVNQLWGDKDYTTICPNPLSDRLAQLALQPENRETILQRSRKIIRSNFAILKNWLESYQRIFTYIPPVAGAIALVNQSLPLSSVDFAEKLRIQKSVLIVPGEQFHLQNCLRFGFGSPATYLKSALARVGEFISTLN